MQAILKLILAIWPLLKNNPKKSFAAGAAGAGALTMGLYSSVQYPPPLIHAGNTTGLPGSSGDTLTTNGSGQWTLTDPAEFQEAIDVGVIDLFDVDNAGDATDGQVLTANGDDSFTFEEPSGGPGGGITTPDGTTTITRTGVFDPFDYGASYSNTDSFVTTATTTATATFDDTTDIVTATAHGLTDGDGINFTTDGTLPTAASGGNIAAETLYYVDVLSSSTFSLHRTRAAATAGTGDIDFTSTGSGTHTGRLKTTVTFNGAGGTPAAAANPYVAGNWLMLFGAGRTCTLSTPVETFDSATATLLSKVGTDPTWTFDDGTDVITLSAEKPLITADPVRVSNSGGALPTGGGGDATFTDAETYYWRRATGSTTGLSLTGTLHPTANDATNNLNIITLTGGSGTQTMLGYSPWYAGTRTGDGEGAWTAALVVGPTYTFNYRTAGDMTTGLLLHAHIAQGGRSNAVYLGTSTTNGKLMTILDGAGLELNTSAADGGEDFTSIASSSGTQVTGSNTLAVDEIVELNATSASDTEYDGQFKVTAATSSTFKINTAFTDTASGYFAPAYYEWRDWGVAVRLMPYKGMPDVENPSYERRASTCYPLGKLLLDSTNNRLWRVHEWMTSAPFSGRTSSAAAPTDTDWSDASANNRVTDGTLNLKRSVEFVPLNVTDGAMRKAHRAKVQSVPTSTTAVLQDAVFGDIGTNKLACTPDDTMPIRNCIAAAAAHTKGAVIRFRPGDPQIHTPKVGATDPDGVAWWSDYRDVPGAQPQYALFVLGYGNDHGHNISLDLAPSCTIRWRALESMSRIDAAADGISWTPEATALFYLGGHRFHRNGGTIMWEDFSGGLSEHDNSGSYPAGYLLYGHSTQADSDNAATIIVPHDLLFTNGRDFAPNWIQGSGSSSDGKYWVQDRINIDNYHIAQGGGDGSGGFISGDFSCTNSWCGIYTRLSSHIWYVNVSRERTDFDNVFFYGCDTTNKSTVQCRGATGNNPIRNLKMTGIRGYHTNNILLGDQTSANPFQGAILDDIQNISVTMAEAEDVQIGEMRGSVALLKDCKNIQIDTLNGSLTANVTGGVSGLEVGKINGASLVHLNNINNSHIGPVVYRNNCVSGSVSVVNEVYSWTSYASGNGGYYLTRRSTGGAPGISQPTHVTIDGRVTLANRSITALENGTAGWGDPASLGYSTLCVKVADGDPDTLPNDFISTGEVVAGAQGLVLGNLNNTNTTSFDLLRTDGSLIAMVTGTASQNEVVRSRIRGGRFRNYGVVATSTSRIVSFGTSAQHWIDSSWEDWYLRGVGSVSNHLNNIFQITYTGGSRYKYDKIDSAYFTGRTAGSGWDVQGGKGELYNSKISGNRCLLSVNGTTEAYTLVTEAQTAGLAAGGGASTITINASGMTHDDAYNGMEILVMHSNGEIEENVVTDYVGSTKVATVRNAWSVTPTTTTQYYLASQPETLDLVQVTCPVYIWGDTTLPTATIDGGSAFAPEGRVLWTQGTTRKFWESRAKAIANDGTGDVEFAGTTNFTCWAASPFWNSQTVFVDAEPIEANTLDWVTVAQNNELRGCRTQQYAQLTTSVGNQQLQPVAEEVHVWTSNNDANAITGFEGGWAGRRITVVNSEFSSNDIVLDHQDSPATSDAENELNTTTGADVTLDPGEWAVFVKPTADGRWQMISTNGA